MNLWSERGYLWEELHARASRLWCRLFGHSLKRIKKMGCSLCARCSRVMEETPRQMVLPAQRRVQDDAVSYAISPTEALETIDWNLTRMRKLLYQHHDHARPVRARRGEVEALEAEIGSLGILRAALTPFPPLRVERSDLLEPDAWANIGDRTVLGRFAWWRLMRTVRAPWPEDFLMPDADYPRDAPPT